MAQRFRRTNVRDLQMLFFSLEGMDSIDASICQLYLHSNTID